ncbi:MAG: isoprenyl transferase [Clostridia bacterium]|nr:isoprenyl transferase [Clostridia bacterium]
MNTLNHIAIIMDGNRRWAKGKGLDPKLGHKEGADNLERIAKFANEKGLKYLTVYAFSTENWKRAEDEVKALMFLMQSYLDSFFKRADKSDIRIKVLGDIKKLSAGLQNTINKVMEKTENNEGLTLNIAFNYGGRDEIVKAVKKIAIAAKSDEINIDDITEELVSNNLYTAGQPDPDLLIRTSGEMRTSNYLPWQLVYSEFLWVDKHWPDFSGEDLLLAVEEYNKRTRKFGAN